jgi:ATP-binding cassette, subfamily B, bacterial MsbA
MHEFRRLYFYVRPFIHLLALALLLLTVAGSMEVFINSLAAPLFDSVLVSKPGGQISETMRWLYTLLDITPENVLWKVAWGLLIFTAIKGICVYLASVSMSYVGQSVVARLRNDLYGHITRQSLAFFSHNSTGRLMSRIINDVEKLQEAVSNTFTDFAREITLMLFLVGYLFYLEWKMACIALLIAPPVLFSTIRLGKRARKLSGSSQERLSGLSNILQETLSGQRVVKAFGMEGYEEAKFKSATHNLLMVNLRSARNLAVNSPLMELLGVLCFIPMIYYASMRIHSNAMSFGEFGVFLFTLARLYDPIRKLSRMHIVVQQALASAARVFEVLDVHQEIEEKPGAKELPLFSGSIEFNAVHFEYVSPGRMSRVLKDINLKVHRGQVLALVGSSGSGKTTLVNLLPRFYDIALGSITLDGYDVRDVTLESLRRQISVVTQETFLFNDSFRYNIAYGNRDTPLEKIEEAAKAALAHDFIMATPQGYDTIIGERGQRLSGGQRQRLAIARAILKDAPILILDEATSALDTESEQLVQRALANLIRNRTTFIVAHRLSTIRRADMIVVLDGGEIREFGSHESLLAHDGIYQRLFRLQFEDLDKAFHTERSAVGPLRGRT